MLLMVMEPRPCVAAWSTSRVNPVLEVQPRWACRPVVAPLVETMGRWFWFAAARSVSWVDGWLVRGLMVHVICSFATSRFDAVSAMVTLPALPGVPEAGTENMLGAVVPGAMYGWLNAVTVMPDWKARIA